MFQETLIDAGRSLGPVSSETNIQGVGGKYSEIDGSSALYSLTMSIAARVRESGSRAAPKAETRRSISGSEKPANPMPVPRQLFSARGMLSLPMLLIAPSPQLPA